MLWCTPEKQKQVVINCAENRTAESQLYRNCITKTAANTDDNNGTTPTKRRFINVFRIKLKQLDGKNTLFLYPFTARRSGLNGHLKLNI